VPQCWVWTARNGYLRAPRSSVQISVMAQDPTWKVGVVAAALDHLGPDASIDDIVKLIGVRAPIVEETLERLRPVTDNSRPTRSRQQTPVTQPLTCSECKNPITGSVTIRFLYGRTRGRRTTCLSCSLYEEPRRQYRCEPVEPDKCLVKQTHERRPCDACGRVLRLLGRYPSRWKPIFCSDACAQRAYNIKRRVDHETIPCAVCGEMFTQTRSDAKTCSNRCRQAAFRIARRT
jgi:hypothetical protein